MWTRPGSGLVKRTECGNLNERDPSLSRTYSFRPLSRQCKTTLGYSCPKFPTHRWLLREYKTRSRGTQSTEHMQDSLTPKHADLYFETDERPIILFDGVCNLCNGGVNFMLDWDREGRARFAALQSPAGQALLQRSGRSPYDISSIVLVENTTSYIKSEAILRIARLLDVPFPFLAGLGMLVPLQLRDPLYDVVATNRYKLFGSTSECRLSDARFEERFVC